MAADPRNLLKRFRATDGEWALLNTNGKPLWRWVEKEGEDATNSRTSLSPTSNCKRRQGYRRKTASRSKTLRKTAASMLQDHAEYGRYAQYFLGHAPHSVADKHYVRPSDEQFDKAVLWLRRATRDRVDGLPQAIKTGTFRTLALGWSQPGKGQFHAQWGPG